MEILMDSWPWYISGPMIALVMGMLIFVGKNFGMSSNLRTLCTICGAGRTTHFFRFDWKSQRWNLLVVLGAIIGGFIGAHLLSTTTDVAIHPEVIHELNTLGFNDAGSAYLPEKLFDTSVFGDGISLIFLIVGGFLVGFGARYAGGCTSGHAISGLSNFQLPSLIAVIGFFIGGLVMVHLLFPLLF
ncbi:YeeE/YedE family protein [Aquimarina brevivitae]|uniref:Uncharacterized protein n=1 Tax=Aquimarina brevivitae TaxID=323412 RepID=A0A4Q7P0I6_9FLAO|nr:YeeE/YedE thiosulfate transporter family protein [Aquimarina brevivitae]RZS93301.1 hypothetical protein EV197_1879 [Aquimarina brevivitae]